MEYILVHDGFVMFGPTSWNPTIFNKILKFDLGIDYTVTRAQENGSKLTIDDKTFVYPSRYVYPADGGNNITTALVGPTWTFNDSEAVGTYVVEDKSVDQVKRELKNFFAGVRYQKQISGTTADINGTTVEVDTTKEYKDTLIAAIADGVGTRNWKFKNTWLSVDNAGLQIAVDAIATHVQEQFDWEATKSTGIDSCSTLEQLYQLFSDYEQSLIPQPPTE